MARVKPAPFITTMFGKFGTATFNKGTNGYVDMRPIVSSENPQTPAQSAVRTAFRRVTQGWRTLTPAQAAAWNEYARSHFEPTRQGARTKVTGFNWYVKYGAKFYAVNAPSATAPAMPPAEPFTGDTIEVVASSEDGVLKFEASAANAANVTTELSYQRLSNANVKPNKSGYRIGMYKRFATGSLSADLDLGPGTYAAAYQFVNTATGEQGPFVTLGVVTVPLAVVQGGAAPAASAKKKAA